MTETVVQERNNQLGEYLLVLRLLAFELNRAMQAIAQNSVSTVEDSITTQQELSERLGQLARELSQPRNEAELSPSNLPDCKLKGEILSASSALDQLNRRYSELLKYSSRSVAQMVALFTSYQGHFQKGSGHGTGYHTWSCQI